MRPLNKSHIWKICYAVCTLVYMAWVVYLSLNNFGMVHRQYRLAGERLQPARIEEIALQELVDRCRRESKRIDRLRSAGEKNSAAAEDNCLSWTTTVLEERQKAVEERLVEEKSRVGRKLVLFYVSFGLVFLILPPAFLYLLLSFFIWIYRSIKFVK
ncbi:MAG: hypothetical protein OEM01_02190 [Desulfobulbaceae bacterium]|nr:hypothetical protein [Desulfobulbaceae bacterium]